jgi:hypothetical protein
MPRRPNLFLVGAPKSGTTSLHRYLQEHPDIYMSRTKEPGYFAPDVVGARPDQPFHYPRDEAAYLALFDNARDEQWVGESSTAYLMSTRAPTLVHEFEPGARAIVMVRNPVDLMYSLHAERVAGGSEQITDFAEAVAADDDRRAGKRMPRRHAGFGVAYSDNAMLGEQGVRWVAAIGRDNVHVIVFDDFAADTPAEFAKVLEFLDVDTSFRPESFAVYNASHRRRGGAARLVRPLLRNRFSRWVSGQALPALIGEQRTMRFANRFGARRLTKQAHERDRLSPDLRRQLAAGFQDDVRKLGSLIDRDLVAEWFGKAG